MATSKPRITVTVEPDVYETLHALAQLQDRSMSSIVSEFLTMVNPIQQKVLAAIQHVSSIQESSKADLVKQLEEGHVLAESAVGPLLQLLDRIGEGDAPERSGSPRSVAEAQPPHSNTGVTLTNPPERVSDKSTSKARSRASGGES